ncbi:MAG: XdhC/CoxI family protein [Phycisphaerae bacterium]|nr:XdhC family protein [Phycisphaerales bacterium]
MILHRPLFEKILTDTKSGKRTMLCAVVKTSGSTPQSPGALLLIDETMHTVGTLGGGCVEAEVRKRAFELLNKGESGLLSFQLNHDYGWDDGLICGGGMDVVATPILSQTDCTQFADILDAIDAGNHAFVTMRAMHDGALCEYKILIEAEPKLVIAGAGHVGVELAKLAVDLEFDVTVIDDRCDCANEKRLPPPIHIIVGDIEQSLRNHKIDKDSYVVIVTRGHNHDEQALAAVIESDARYIGMIGSRRKIKLIYDDLAATGIDPTLFDRVHAPIGVKINSVTVPEIAISIIAELISVRRENTRRLVEGPITVES